MVSLSGRAPVAAPSALAGLVRATAVVTLTDETGVRGVVLTADPSGLLMAPAAGQPVEVWAPGGEWSPADGALFIPAAQVKFVQLPEGI